MVRSKPAQQYIRYDPERTDYTVTEAELEILERGNAPLWKDVFLVSLPLAASTLFNAYGEARTQTGEMFTLTLPIFMNSVIGVVAVGFTLLAGVAWYKSKISFRAVVDRIKNKPLYPVPPGTFPTKADTEQEADPQSRVKKRDKTSPSPSTPASVKDDATQGRGERETESPTEEEGEGGEI